MLYIWTLSALTSQLKNDGNSVGILYRVVLREMVFRYKIIYIQQGEAYVLSYKANVSSFVSLSKLRSGFAWCDYFTLPHHAN